MGRNPNKDESAEFLKYLRSGRDSMGLIECSIAGADSKPDRKTGSIRFAREGKHPRTGETIDQSWLVTFSSEYGRPTPKDDDIFVALMKASYAQGLMDKNPEDRPSSRARFSSYQLIKTLQWDEGGASYKAIDDALNRLCGVLIVAKNYEWDEEEQEMADRKFGIIDQVSLYERDKYDKALKRAREEGRDRPTSWAEWSEVMMRSFQAGDVRRLDMEVYNSLKNPLARKLYRYLGKQFWIQTDGTAKRRKHTIGIRPLCHYKLGVTPNEERTNRLKQKIEPALAELIGRDIYGLRFDYESSYGKCDVVFTSNKKKTQAKKKEGQGGGLAQRLIAMGIERGAALRFEKEHKPERIVEDIEHAEYMEKNKLLKKSKSDALFTMLSSEQPWGRPDGFVSSIEKEKRKQATAEKRRLESERKAKEKAEREEQQAENEREFSAFVEAMTDKQRTAYAETAVVKFSILYGQKLRKAKRSGSESEVEQCYRDAMHCLWLNEREETHQQQ